MTTEDEIPAIVRDKISARAMKTIERCREFVDLYCLPAEKLYEKEMEDFGAARWEKKPKTIEKLKQKAREMGLWNMFLPKRYGESPGYTNLEYGLMAQYLGRSFIAPEATNCNAPDTGNMELFARYGNRQQKERWLKPLLDGEIRSAFLMTEKGTSSSNALNISCSARLNEKGNYMINGHKWFSSGAGDPHCAVWLVMCKTSENSKVPYRNHSVLVLDARKALASGRAKLIRPLTVFGYDDAPHGHMEIKFDDYEVPSEDMSNIVLADVGKGFELIQSRLGPGRIHHCMRLIGAGEYALLRVTHRANNRVIFGKPMKDRESFITSFAQHKIDIQRCRLLILDAAHKIDISSPKDALREISMAKIETPRTILKILDWCIQMYGAEGVSQDTELARLYAVNRTLRIADGPDEAHLNQLGRSEAKKFALADGFFAQVEKNVEKLAKL